MRQDFQPAGEEQYEAAPAAPAQPAEPEYVRELERLAQLRDDGVITSDEFDAKKRQLLGL